MSQPPQVSGWGFTLPDWGGYNIMKKDEQSAYQKALDAQTNLSNTAWQRGVADMSAAGINPMLAVQQGPASTPNVHKMQNPTPPGVSSSVQMQTAAQVRNLDAQSEKAHAEAESIREGIPTHGMERELKGHQSAEIRQRIAESIFRVDKIIEETNVHAATAANVRQQTANLEEAITQIKATVELLKSQSGEIGQRVKENLPKIEADLRKLEVIFREMERPGRQQTSDYQQTGAGQVLQSIGNALKQLSPITPNINVR